MNPMNASFDRLLNLAKRTGDTLIIFDKYDGNHQVVMDVDVYEDLVNHSNPPVGSLSEQELIERLNTDISLWRESQTMEATDDINFISDADQGSDWHSAGEVLDHMHPEFESTESNDLQEHMFNQNDDLELSFEQNDTGVDLNYDPVMQDPAPIPMIEHDASEEVNDAFQEEPLEEDPIFFEEPIN